MKKRIGMFFAAAMAAMCAQANTCTNPNTGRAFGSFNVALKSSQKTDDTHDKVQLWEGGPYWATTNIGAEEPWEYGYYFWWGDTVGYTRSGGTWTDYGYGDGSGYYDGVTWVTSDGSSSGLQFGENDPISGQTFYKSIAALQSEGWIVSQDDGTYVLAPEHDAAHVQWGGGWRMPTYQELEDLRYNCDWTWTTMHGVNGCIVRGRGDYASASIFLPYAGAGYVDWLDGVGSAGRFWSSEPDLDSDYDLGLARFLYFDSRDGGAYPTRSSGQSVRPVQEYGGTSGGGSAGGGDVVDDGIAGRFNTGFAKAQVVLGALYGRDGVPVGSVQMKVGKVNTKKRTVKIAATATLLADGKAKKVAAKAVTVKVGTAAAGTAAPHVTATITFKSPIGKMSFEMEADGTFKLKNDSYVMVEKKVGGSWTRTGAGVYLDGGRGATALPAGTIEELLPDGEPVIPKAGKWSFAKAAGVKYAKDKKTKVASLVVDTKKGKNLSGMKLTYTPKTGVFKGSFKIYAIQGGKLKKFTAKVIGVVIDWKGWGRAAGPNGARWGVMVE